VHKYVLLTENFSFSRNFYNLFLIILLPLLFYFFMACIFNITYTCSLKIISKNTIFYYLFFYLISYDLEPFILHLKLYSFTLSYNTMSIKVEYYSNIYLFYTYYFYFSILVFSFFFALW